MQIETILANHGFSFMGSTREGFLRTALKDGVETDVILRRRRYIHPSGTIATIGCSSLILMRRARGLNFGSIVIPTGDAKMVEQILAPLRPRQ